MNMAIININYFIRIAQKTFKLKGLIININYLWCYNNIITHGEV